MSRPILLCGKPLAAQEAELREATFGPTSALALKAPFVTGIDVSPILYGWFTSSTPRSAITLTEEGMDEALTYAVRTGSYTYQAPSHAGIRLQSRTCRE